jgi:hypothetical protein
MLSIGVGSFESATISNRFSMSTRSKTTSLEGRKAYLTQRLMGGKYGNNRVGGLLEMT